jgi:DNA-directed RNA polymerase subunit RPC12/RpoP
MKHCAICSREFDSEELKEVDDFSCSGEHVCILICAECEADFEELDIVFDFNVDSDII